MIARDELSEYADDCEGRKDWGKKGGEKGMLEKILREKREKEKKKCAHRKSLYSMTQEKKKKAR